MSLDDLNDLEKVFTEKLIQTHQNQGMFKIGIFENRKILAGRAPERIACVLMEFDLDLTQVGRFYIVARDEELLAIAGPVLQIA